MIQRQSKAIHKTVVQPGHAPAYSMEGSWHSFLQ